MVHGDRRQGQAHSFSHSQGYQSPPLTMGMPLCPLADERQASFFEVPSSSLALTTFPHEVRSSLFGPVFKTSSMEMSPSITLTTKLTIPTNPPATNPIGPHEVDNTTHSTMDNWHR